MIAIRTKPEPARLIRPLALGLFVLFGVVHDVAAEQRARSRRPVALAFSRDGSRLFVANERSGSLTLLDPIAARVIGEHDLGRSLSDVAALPDGRHLLALDQAADTLLLLEHRDDTIRVVARRAVGFDPVSLALAADGSFCVVASRWSRSLTFVDLRKEECRVRCADRPEPGSVRTADPTSPECAPQLIDLGTLSMPFSPRLMTFVHEGSRLVVADAFGGGLAVVDVCRREIESVRTIRAHNIRGMSPTPDGKTLLLAHQALSAPARTVQDEVQWGVLLNNHVRGVDLASLAPGTRPAAIDEARQGTRGELGRGSGDPSAIAWGAGGTVLVALSGVDQVAYGTDPFQLHSRIAVGRRPTAIAVSPDGRLACVAETLDDSVSVIEIATRRQFGQVALGPETAPTLEDRGARVFFDARISRGGWMSCQSCHTDGHSNGLNVDTFGDHEFGAPKRIPSLLGTGDTGPWGWKGVFPRLEDQVHESVLTTMHGTFPTDDDVVALAAFVRSLPAPRPVPASVLQKAAIERGAELFASRCARCHAPPSYTSPKRYDVGLVDEAGDTEFNPPSLRGVGLRTPLLHDGRAATLDEVLGKFGHPAGRENSPREIADLVAFLRSF